jgi:RNA polymerase sigma-70 factor (ECF subfamily)
MTEYNDKELFDLFLNTETRHYGFNLLVNKYKERLYWHIRRMVINHDDADDLLQNTFLKIWQGLERFRGESSLYTWFYRIATNECISFLNKQRTRFFLPLADVEKKLEHSLETDPWFDGNELQKKLQKAMLNLPEKQRLVFNLRYFEEMPYEEMSKVLQTSEGALKASYHHAVKKIEKYFESD